MKALAVSFSILASTALSAPRAEAHFMPGFHPTPQIGPKHGSGSMEGGRPDQRHRSGQGADWSAFPDWDDTPADAASDAPPQVVPVPVPVPYGVTVWQPSQPRLILIGAAARSRPQGHLPKVIYGDPLPKSSRP